MRAAWAAGLLSPGLQVSVHHSGDGLPASRLEVSHNCACGFMGFLVLRKSSFLPSLKSSKSQKQNCPSTPQTVKADHHNPGSSGSGAELP
jgi:hypothetical protein